MMWLRAAAVAVAMVASLTGVARAEVKRYAFLIGSNRGAAHEVPLRFAESDVGAVADTLNRLGGFASERTVRLAAPTGERVRRALLDLNLRIQQEMRVGDEAVLFVFYSGHADAANLHLGGTQLATDELSGLVRLSPAKLKILLVDACRAGTLTRVKGGRQVAPFQIGAQDQLRQQGYAIITSSAAGEDAQESDALRSSTFTHHFLSALRGAADSNRDHVVTLGEAYAYAYEQTLKSSMTTLVGAQHATYDYDLRGRADPVLADLRTIGDHAQVLLSTPGDYLLTSTGSDAVLIEASVKTPSATLLVPAGRFAVRLRTRTNVYQTELAFSPGVPTVLGEQSMSPVPLAQVVRKGETEARFAHGPTVAASMHGPLGSGLSAMVGAQASWAFELPFFTLLPRVGVATGHATQLGDNTRSHSVGELAVEVTALRVFDLGKLSVAPLISVGPGFLRQVVEPIACTPPAVDCSFEARPVALVTTIGAWAAWSLGRGFLIEATAELANFYLRRQQKADGFDAQAELSGALTARASVGVGYRY